MSTSRQCKQTPFKLIDLEFLVLGEQLSDLLVKEAILSIVFIEQGLKLDDVVRLRIRAEFFV